VLAKVVLTTRLAKKAIEPPPHQDEHGTQEGTIEGGKTEEGKTDDGKTEEGESEGGKSEEGKSEGEKSGGCQSEGGSITSSTSLFGFPMPLRPAQPPQPPQTTVRSVELQVASGAVVKLGPNGKPIEPVRLQFRPFKPSLGGLIQARKVCRSEMAKIVNEVDLITKDPKLAIDTRRDELFLEPLVYKQLLPVSSSPVTVHPKWTVLMIMPGRTHMV
jgi:hypothetical protein